RSNRPVWTLGHTEELQASLGEVLGGLPPADDLGIRLTDDRPRRLHLGGGEAGPGEQGAQHAPVAGGAALERDQRRQRFLSILEVAADRLAGLRGRSPDADDIVDHLKRNPQVVTELAGFFERGLANTGSDTAKPRRALEERGGFEADHLQVLIDADIHPLLELQVEDLAATEREHAFREQGQCRPEAIDVARREQVDDGAGDERLERGAGVDRLVDAPELPDAGAREAKVRPLTII